MTTNADLNYTLIIKVAAPSHRQVGDELPLYTDGNSFSFRTKSKYKVKLYKHSLFSFLFFVSSVSSFGEINLGYLGSPYINPPSRGGLFVRPTLGGSIFAN